MATPYQNGNGNGKDEAIEYELFNDRNIKLIMSTYNQVKDGVLELHGDLNLVVKSVQTSTQALGVCYEMQQNEGDRWDCM